MADADICAYLFSMFIFESAECRRMSTKRDHHISKRNAEKIFQNNGNMKNVAMKPLEMLIRMDKKQNYLIAKVNRRGKIEKTYPFAVLAPRKGCIDMIRTWRQWLISKQTRGQKI